MLLMKTFESKSLEDTKKVAAEWLADISNMYANSGEALVTGLSGHLGAGKTAFVKAIANIMGVKEEVTSPTFVIMKIYETKHPVWPRLVHIDAYRLERREELEALRFEEVVADKNNLVLIEWPENVGMDDFKAGAYLKFEIVEGAHSIIVR